MPKQKMHAYFLFLKEIRDEKRGTMAPEMLSTYVSELWTRMSPDEKAVYKAKAELFNAEIRKSTPIAPEQPVKEVPIDLLPRGMQLVKKAETYLNFCGKERIMLMNRRFVSMCVNPLFKIPVRGGESDFLPGEIAFVRWSIASGLEEVYHVFINPGKPEGAISVNYNEWNECTQMTACKDIDIIADEIIDFIGAAAAVLTRPALIERATRCLNHILKDTEVGLIDQSAVCHLLLTRELCTRKKDKSKISIGDVRDKFPAQSGSTGVRVNSKGEHTGIRCAWHANTTLCAARRAVEDSYIMVKELSSVYQANCVAGKHYALNNFLVPRRFHNCRQQVDLGILMQRALQFA